MFTTAAGLKISQALVHCKQQLSQTQNEMTVKTIWKFDPSEYLEHFGNF